VDRAEITVGPGPLVPDRDAVVLQPARVPVAAQEPQQLVGHRAEVHLLRGDQREAVGQPVAQLVAEDRTRARAGPVRLAGPGVEHAAEQVLVLRVRHAPSSPAKVCVVGARSYARADRAPDDAPTARAIDGLIPPQRGSDRARTGSPSTANAPLARASVSASRPR